LSIALILTALIAAPVWANSIGSSTMEFEGTLTDDGDGTYSGVIPMIVGGAYDVYAEEGGTAWFGNDPGTGPVWTSQAIGADHDAWPTWNPDTPDWYQYSLELYVDGSTEKWAVRNHPGATETNPWYDEAHWGAGGKPPAGVPMSGLMGYSYPYALETDVGAYLSGTGTPDIPGGAAGYGGGPGAWDMDWSWGSEAVPLEYAGFDVDIQDLGGGTYHVTLTPAALTEVWVDDDFTSATPGWGVTHFASIQDGIDAVEGSTVNVADGTYAIATTLNVNKSVTIDGESEAGVILDASGCAGYGMLVTADGVVLRDMTMLPPAVNYPIHASGTGNPPDGYDGLTIERMTIEGVHQRTAFDIHGYSNVLLSYLTAGDATGGNGIQVTGCLHVDMDNIVTHDNAWGSIAIYCSSGSYLNRGSDDVEIDGDTCTLGESNIYSQDEFGLTNTNVTVVGYEYLVKNDTVLPGYDLFQDTLTDAGTVAASVGAGSYITEIATGDLVVLSGMSIQDAIDAADPGDEVHVANGNYSESLDIYKSLSLLGESEAGVVIDASSFADYSIDAMGDYDFVFHDFTLIGHPTHTSAFGLKIAGENATCDVRRVTIQDCYRTGLNLNGLASGVIDDCTVTGSVYGVGLGMADCDNIAVSNLTTSGNAWAGMSVEAAGNFFNGGSDGVSLTGTNSFGETLPLYTEEANGYEVTNFQVSVTDLAALSGNTLNPGAVGYFSDVATAQAAVIAGGDPAHGWVYDRVGALFAVTSGMYIQPAIDAADDYDTISVSAGTYLERPVVNKSLTIVGADEATTVIDAGAGATGGSYGFTVSADDVTITDLTLVGDTGLSTPRYGFKPSGVSNFTLTNVTATEFYRTGVDLNGVSSASLTDVVSFDNGGHGVALTDCNGVTLTNTDVSGNGWQGISVQTWGSSYALGTSGIVFQGTNSFADPFQLEMGDAANPGVPPAGDAIITYSTNIGDGADVTVQGSDFGFAVHGEQDDGPGQARIWFAADLTSAQVLPASAPIGHFTGGGMYIESLTDPTQLYCSPGCEIQAAVDAASTGYDVNVQAGVYSETVTVDKAIELLGSDGAILEGTGLSGAAVSIESGGVTLDGFEIRNYTDGNGVLAYVTSYGGDWSNIAITNNTVHNIAGPSHGFGIYVGTEGERYDSTDATGTGLYDPTFLDLLDFTGLTITGNEVYNSSNAAVVVQAVQSSGDALDVSGNYLHDAGASGLWIDSARDIDVAGNTLSGNSNGVFVSGYADGYYEGDPTGPYDPSQIAITGNIISGNSSQGVAVYDLSCGGVLVTGNSISGNGSGGALNYVAACTLYAEDNWWGAADGPSGFGPGSGDAVSDYVDFSPWLTGNIICTPDPDTLTIADQLAEIDVDYLGGGSGLVYGYTVGVTYDSTLVRAGIADVTEGTLLSSVNSTFFTVQQPYAGAFTIDCIILGPHPGVTGPGTMFSIDFHAKVPIGYGVSPVDIIVDRVRDMGNGDLTGFFADDGEIIVDTSAPSVTGVEIHNDDPDVSDNWVKNGDPITVTATVTDAHPSFGIDDIEADLTDLGGAADAAPGSYDGTWATWDIATATCTPADGTLTVTVTAVDALGNTGSGTDTIEADNTAPSAVTGFDAAPAHEECVLSWTNGTDDHYAGTVVRRGYTAAAYPQYTWFATNWPNVDGEYPTDEEDGEPAYDGTGSSYTDSPGSRNIYYYQAFSYDEARNYGPAATGARDLATNYWLGDISSGWGSWGHDGEVDQNDILKLSYVYGRANPDTVPGEAECDVGPTVHPDWNRLGLPKPDDIVEFEDAMIFAMNYGVVMPRVVPFLPEEYSGDVLALTLEEREAANDVVEVALRLEGNTDEVKGMSASIAFDSDQLEFVSAALSEDMSSPLAEVFFWSGVQEGRLIVDALVLGTDVTIGGSGDVAVLAFRNVGDGYALDIESARIRNADNVELDAKLGDLESGGKTPLVFRLLQNAPNPFNPVTKIAYHVPRESDVTIRVFDVSGRVVATLVDGVSEPGRHVAVWNGLNDQGESVGSGVYFCTMEAPDFHDSRKMTLLK
jgi:nitrous oxidase accessory protein NosD